MSLLCRAAIPVALNLPVVLQDQEREGICLLSNKSPAELPKIVEQKPA